MKTDPWAAAPTSAEMTPQKRRGPSPGGTSTLDLLKRGMDWAGAKQAEGMQDKPHGEMFMRLMGMGGMRALPSVAPLGGRMPAAEPAPSAQPVAVDPVLEQIRRVSGSPAPAPTSPLPELPKMLDWVLPGKATKIYDILRKATQRAPAATEIPQSPLSGGGGEQWRMPAAPPAQTPRPPPAGPLMSEIETPQAPEVAPPQAPPAAPPVAATAPAAPAPVANIFERAARGRKVSELAKAIDANASAHLGVDPMDPRFGEALASMPEQWWEGMGSVAKINKPSPDTIAEVLAFYRDRAGQAAQKITP